MYLFGRPRQKGRKPPDLSLSNEMRDGSTVRLREIAVLELLVCHKSEMASAGCADLKTVRGSAAKVIDEPENQADGHADEQAGDDREIKRAVLAAVDDISWQTAETEGQFWAEVEQGADGDQGSPRASEKYGRVVARVPHRDCSAVLTPDDCWAGERLRDGDASYEIVLFGDGFGADGEGVENAEAKCEAQSLVLAIAKSALAEDFHSDDGFAGRFHFAKNADRQYRARASMNAPTGLTRARSTSTHGDLAAARRASMEWQEQPWARMMPFCLASESTSMTGW